MCPLAATTVEEVEAEVEELVEVERMEVPKGSSLELWKGEKNGVSAMKICRELFSLMEIITSN